MSIAHLVTIVESSGNFLALVLTQTESPANICAGGVLADGLGSAFQLPLCPPHHSLHSSQNIGVISNGRGKSSRGCANWCTSSASGFTSLYSGALIVSIFITSIRAVQAY